MVAVNCGKAVSSGLALNALAQRISCISQSWVVLYLSELDALGPSSRHLDDSNFVVHRHHPGGGSWAMAFVIKRSFSFAVHGLWWSGRVGALHLLHRDALGRFLFNVFVVGCHGPHGEREDFLTDLNAILLKKPRLAKVLMLGDWNVDQLPVLQTDPFSGSRSRRKHHEEERSLLAAFVRAQGLQLRTPRPSPVSSGGSFSDFTTTTAISRIPLGEQARSQKPSCLDYAVVGAKVLKDLQLHWGCAVADHAALFATLAEARQWEVFRNQRWRCNDLNFATRWAYDNVPERLVDFDAVSAYVGDLQAANADVMPRAQRRQAFMSTMVSTAWRRVAATASDSQRICRRNAAWQATLQEQSHVTLQTQTRKLRGGRTLKKQKKLHTIEAVILTEASGAGLAGLRSYNTAQWHREFQSCFESKWGTSNLDKHVRTLDIVLQTECVSLDFCNWETERALQRIRDKGRIDRDGISAGALQVVLRAAPSTVTYALDRLATSTASTSRCVVYGKLQGKKSSTVQAQKRGLPFRCLCDYKSLTSF